MNWIETTGTICIVSWWALFIYGWRHQDRPFWREFCNPFCLDNKRK